MDEAKLVKQSKREFRKYAVPYFPVGVTMPVSINGHIYMMVVQNTAPTSIFTNYKVIDELGHEAPIHIRETVFAYITKIQLLTQFIYLRESMAEQQVAVTNEEAQDLLALYHKQTGKDYTILFSKYEQLDSLLLQASDQLENSLKENEPYPIETLENINKNWEEIREIYEQRIPVLLSYRNYTLDELLVDQELPEGLDSLLEEAHYIYEIFYQPIQVDPIHLCDLNAFIELNGQLGHSELTSDKQIALTKGEKLSREIFRWVTYFLVVLYAAYKISNGGINIPLAFNVAVLLFVSYILHMLSSRGLRNTLVARTNKQRKQQIINDLQTRGIFQKAYNVDPTILEQSEEDPNSNVIIETVSGRNSILTMLAGGTILMYAILTFNEDTNTDAILVLLGLLIIVIGAFIPEQTKSKRKLILTNNGLKYGRYKIDKEHLGKITAVKSGKRYEIYSTQLSEPLKIRVPKEKIDQTKIEIKIWCTRTLIIFDEE